MQASVVSILVLRYCLLRAGSMRAEGICRKLNLTFYTKKRLLFSACWRCSHAQPPLVYVSSTSRSIESPASIAGGQQMLCHYCYKYKAHQGQASLQILQFQCLTSNPVSIFCKFGLPKSTRLIEPYLIVCTCATSERKTRFSQQTTNHINQLCV